MNRSIIILLFVFISLPAFAQNWREADSLRKALSRSNPDTGRAHTLLRLAEFEVFKPGEFKKDLDSAAVYIGQAKNINKNIHSLEVDGHIALAESNMVKEQGQKEQGKALVEKAIQILSKGTDGYQLGQSYLSLAEYYDYNNMAELPKKFDAVTRAATTFNNTGYIEREAYAYKILGDIDTSYVLALKHLNRSLDLYQSKHYKLLQGVYDAIGTVYLVQTNYRPALKYQLKALKAAQDTHDTTMQLCEINNHIGITYFKLLEFDQAIKYFKAALHTAEAYEDFRTVYLLATNICNAEIRLKHPKEVLDILQHTLNKYPLQSDVENDVRFTNDYVQAYTMLKQYDRAKPYSHHLISIINHNSISRKTTLSDAYVALITYFFGSKQYQRELIYLKKNDTLIKQLNIPANISVNNNAWFRLDTAQHNYKAAVQHLLIHKQIQDSTFTATKNKQIKQLQIEYETKEKENQIRLLNQQSALQQSNLKQAGLIEDVTVGGIVLVLIIAGLLYRQSKLRKKNNQIITRQNELITHKNELLQSLVTEKEWLLKEVHHRVKNNLHSVISLLEAQAAYLENDALQAIENSQHRIYAMSLIHQKLYQSEDVKTIDTTTYIPELVQYLRDSYDINRIHFNLTIDPIQLNASQAIPLGLIINEALTNSIKYAFPDGRRGEIIVSLTESGEKYKLELADNGIGMQKKVNGDEKSSLGLELMKGLAKEIRGNIAFEYSNGVKIIILFERDLSHNMDQGQEDYLASA